MKPFLKNTLKQLEKSKRKKVIWGLMAFVIALFFHVAGLIALWFTSDETMALLIAYSMAAIGGGLGMWFYFLLPFHLRRWIAQDSENI